MGISSFSSSRRITTTVFISILCLCFGIYGSKSCLMEERIALLQLRDSFKYSNGSVVINDWVGDDCCQWSSITCDSTYHVISISIFHAIYSDIDLYHGRDVQLETWYPNASLFIHFKKLQSLAFSNTNIGGWIMPQALCELRNLVSLSLAGNSLDEVGFPRCLAHGLPSLETIYLVRNSVKLSSPFLSGLICGMKKLKELDLSQNGLIDEDLPSCLFYNNSVLKSLLLESNNLRGSIGFSTGLCKLGKLQYLRLDMNSIQNIPWTCLSRLNYLKGLLLSHNQIAGTIPSPLISNFTSLQTIFLDDNKFEGVAFFSMFANLSKLEQVNLSNNKDLQIETEFPTWVPSFQLMSLYLENCKLRTFPLFISTQYNLWDLVLSHNSLQGTIPSWLCNATPYLYSLFLTDNQLHGPFPLPFKNETSRISRLQDLDISGNNIQGILPGNMDVLFPSIGYLNMSRNKLQGCIPPSFGNLISILDLSNNYFVGEVPRGLTQNSTSLLHLILSRNNLHAMPRISNMTSLRTLSLDGNLFTRPFPITASSVPSLVILDMSRNSMLGNIQDWVSTGDFPNLVSLVMRENHFVGHLPPSLCQMYKLRVLDLADNNLSGTIPSCFNNITSWLKESQIDSLFGFNSWVAGEEDIYIIQFTTKGNLYTYKGFPLHQMTGIDLSLNQLSGDIPFQIGELRALRSLNLSHNSLMGYLPVSFQELKLVESLDLSHNKLVGVIPPQMIQLSFLSTFSVAFNQLSGKIPYEKNFATFTKESYVGNPGLCGPPIEVNCSSPQPHHIAHREGDDEEQSLLDNNLLFYSYVAICFLLGFWAVIAPLLLSRNWRSMYYRIVDRCIDWCSDKLFWCLYYMKNH